MTELVLVRHGETEWNRERRIQGHLDTALSALGREQARLTAERLRALHAERPFARIVASDLSRVVQTAQPSAAALGLALQCTPDWRERAFGVLEGRLLASIDAEVPEVAAGWRSREPGYVIPGGESLIGFMARVRVGIEALHAQAAGARVLVFTHGGVLDMAFRVATGVGVEPQRACAIHNASLNTLRRVGERWEVVDWGDVDHLGSAGPAGPAGLAPATALR